MNEIFSKKGKILKKFPLSVSGTTGMMLQVFF